MGLQRRGVFVAPRRATCRFIWLTLQHHAILHKAPALGALAASFRGSCTSFHQSWIADELHYACIGKPETLPAVQHGCTSFYRLYLHKCVFEHLFRT